MYTCNPSTLGLKQENDKFNADLRYSMRHCQRKEGKERRRWRGREGRLASLEGKLRKREVKPIAQGYTARKQQSQHSNPGSQSKRTRIEHHAVSLLTRQSALGGSFLPWQEKETLTIEVCQVQYYNRINPTYASRMPDKRAWNNRREHDTTMELWGKWPDRSRDNHLLPSTHTHKHFSIKQELTIGVL